MFAVWVDFCEILCDPGCINVKEKSERWRAAKRYLSMLWVLKKQGRVQCPFAGGGE